MKKQACPNHGGYWSDIPNTCPKEHDMASHTHQLEARTLGPEGYHIIWRLNKEDKIWRAYRDTKRVQKQYIRLHLLDTSEMIEVFKFMRDIVTGRIDEDLINPEL